MIRNIIFDMGNVLLQFNGDYLLEKYVSDADERKLLMKEVFGSGDWAKMDWGELREEDLAALVCPRVPTHLQAPLHQMLTTWYHDLILIDQSYHLIEELKENGYRIYLLSNAGYSLDEVYHKDVPAIGLMDGRIVSALEGTVKPHDPIYQILLDRFDLKAEECFFIDDLQENIEGAKRNGIAGHIFDGDNRALRLALQQAGVSVNTTVTLAPVMTTTEIDTLATLAHEIWNQHFVPIIGQGQVDYMLEKFQSKDALQKAIDHDGYHYYFLCYDGEVVGYVGFQLQDHGLFLSKLYVKQAYRGRKIAKYAMDFLCSVCRDRDKDHIYLTVNRHNDNTIAAYTKMGFVVREEKQADIGNGYVMDDYIMQKTI